MANISFVEFWDIQEQLFQTESTTISDKSRYLHYRTSVNNAGIQVRVHGYAMSRKSQTEGIWRLSDGT